MYQEAGVVNLINKLEKKLASRYTRMFINGRFCFMDPTGKVFSVRQFPGAAAIVVEYADNCAEAEMNRFEDGDRHYISDTDDETLITNILDEIER